MHEPLACPCTLYDPHDPDARSETTLAWYGKPDIVQSVTLPLRLHPNESFTERTLTLAPMPDAVRATVETPDEVHVEFVGTKGEDSSVLLPDPRAPTDWYATFVVADIPLRRPRKIHGRLVVERIAPARWFARSVASLFAISALVALACLGIVITTGAFAALVGFLAGVAAMAVANPASYRWLSRISGFRLPTTCQPLGTVSFPGIDVEPLVRRSEYADHEHIRGYSDRLADEMSRISVLGLSSPINLSDGYVPTRLHVRRGADTPLDIRQQPYSQVDELIDADLNLKQLIGGEAFTPEEAWQKFRCLTVIGDVGSGKTTILRKLAIGLCRGPILWSVSVPVLLELHLLARRLQQAPDPLTCLREVIVETIVGPDTTDDRAAQVGECVAGLIEAGQLTLMFDGLDEVSGPGDDEDLLLDAAIGAISQAAGTWTDVHIIVTCRRASMDRYRRLPGAFVTAETTPFSGDGIRAFVRRYFADSSDLASRLLEEIERNPRIRGMAASPLLLALITLIFEQRGSLPQRRTEVYRRCADLLLREWDEQRDRDRFPRFQIEDKEELLRRVAWDIHSEGVRYLTAKHLTDLVRLHLPSIGLQSDAAEDVVREISAHHGILRPYDAEWYGFVHLALQEFFAAECIERRTPLAEVLTHRHKAWWREIIRLYAGRGDCTHLILTLMGEPEDLFQSNLLLAGECLAQGTAVEPELREHVLSELRRSADQHRYPGLDIRFWRVLVQAAGEEYAERLWEVVADRDTTVEVRSTIVSEMPASLGASFGAHALRYVKDEEIAPQVRIAIARALCSAQSCEPSDTLVGILGDPAIAEPVRATVAQALGGTGNLWLIGTLQELVLDHALPVVVRHEVAASLRALGSTKITPRLLQMLGDWHIEPPIRVSLAAVVGELGEEAYATEIVSLLMDSRVPSSVRTALALSLKSLRSPVLTDSLLAMLADQKTDYGVRLALADATSHTATEAQIAEIRALFSSRSVEEPIRLRLAVALGSLGDVGVNPQLVRLLGDRSARTHLRTEAARILSVSSGSGIREAMMEILDGRSTDPLGQELAVLVLGVRNEPGTAAALVDRLSDRRLPLSARLRMVDTLATLGGSDQVDRLVSLITDRSFTVELRGRIALTVARITDARDKRSFERVAQFLPEMEDVPEVVTLAAHLGEQIGLTVYPSDYGAPPISYPWIGSWTKTGEDKPSGVEDSAE